MSSVSAFSTSVDNIVFTFVMQRPKSESGRVSGPSRLQQLKPLVRSVAKTTAEKRRWSEVGVGVGVGVGDTLSSHCIMQAKY